VNGLIIAVIALGEVAGLLLITLCVIGRLWWQQRRLVRELQAQLERKWSGRDSYLARLKEALQGLLRRYSERLGANIAALHTGEGLRAPAQPEQVALQLGYEYLRREVQLLDDPRRLQEYWPHREQGALEMLACLESAEAVLRQWWETEQQRQKQALEHARQEQGETIVTLQRKVQRRDISLETQTQRITELESTQAWLRDQLVHERNAGLAMRYDLRCSGLAPQLEALLTQYEQERAPLDRYLDGASTGLKPPTSNSSSDAPSDMHRLRRQQRLLERSESVVEEKHQALRRAVEQQQQIILGLREKVEQAEEREEAIKTYYRQQVRKLQEALVSSRHSAEGLEKEIARSKRTIRSMVNRFEKKEAEAASQADLEATIERFSTQAISMQQRIQALEQELANLSTENLTLKARAATTRPDAAENPSGSDAPGVERA
jgi:hypothetical protein